MTEEALHKAQRVYIADSTEVGVARRILASNLRDRRLARRWSQEFLGFECGLHRTFIAHVEGGVRNISIDNLERLASALCVQTYELLMPLNIGPGSSD